MTKGTDSEIIYCLREKNDQYELGSPIEELAALEESAF